MLQVVKMNRAYDPSLELSRHLFPNGHHEAKTSDKSLDRPFALLAEFRRKHRNSHQGKEATMAYFGIDLHLNNFAVCRMNEDGTTALGSFRTDPDSMDSFRSALFLDDETSSPDS